MTEYKEGNHDTDSTEDIEETHKENEIPTTAFLLLQYDDGRVEAATKLSHIQMKNEATLKQVRDICRSMYDDVMVTMSSGTAAEIVSKRMLEASKKAILGRMVSNLTPNVGERK